VVISGVNKAYHLAFLEMLLRFDVIHYATGSGIFARFSCSSAGVIWQLSQLVDKSISLTRATVIIPDHGFDVMVSAHFVSRDVTDSVSHRIAKIFHLTPYDIFSGSSSHFAFYQDIH
jgi:hypothetical protein